MMHRENLLLLLFRIIKFDVGVGVFGKSEKKQKQNQVKIEQILVQRIILL